MTPPEAQTVRAALSLTQDELAQVLGVHPMTISKWERGLLTPDPENAAIYNLLLPWSGTRIASLGSEIRYLLTTRGVLAARAHLLVSITADTGQGGSCNDS